jgi:hypothetical protein
VLPYSIGGNKPIVGRRDAVGAIELLLRTLILNEADDRRLRKHLLAHRLQLVQGIDIHVLYFNGDDVHRLPEGEHRFEIVETPLGELMADVATRRIGIGVEHMDIDIEVDGLADQHAAQLPSAKDAETGLRSVTHAGKSSLAKPFRSTLLGLSCHTTATPIFARPFKTYDGGTAHSTAR